MKQLVSGRMTCIAFANMVVYALLCLKGKTGFMRLARAQTESVGNSISQPQTTRTLMRSRIREDVKGRDLV
jgi:hypothetical protein